MENNIVFCFSFQRRNFFHLLGLQKLKDVPALQSRDKALVYKNILSGKISCKDIESSAQYPKIKNRILHFENICKMLNPKHSKVVIDFDPTKTERTKLTRTRYIFFLRERSGYDHLTIGYNNEYYPETFIFEYGKRYITQQELLNISEITVEQIEKREN